MCIRDRSYQLAAKYMPSGGGQQLPSKALVSDGETASERKAVATTRNGKAVAFPVAPVSEQVVSALAQPMSDSTFRSEYVKERNFLFQTAIGTASQTERNTISAVSYTHLIPMRRKEDSPSASCGEKESVEETPEEERELSEEVKRPLSRTDVYKRQTYYNLAGEKEKEMTVSAITEVDTKYHKYRFKEMTMINLKNKRRCV